MATHIQHSRPEALARDLPSGEGLSAGPSFPQVDLHKALGQMELGDLVEGRRKTQKNPHHAFVLRPLRNGSSMSAVQVVFRKDSRGKDSQGRSDA